MSRTYRKRAETFEQYYSYWFDAGLWDDETELNERRYRYKTRSDKWFSYNLPKGFRNSVNRKRRRVDRHEIYKAINFEDYPEQCSMYNCKDNNAWGYW